MGKYFLRELVLHQGNSILQNANMLCAFCYMIFMEEDGWDSVCECAHGNELVKRFILLYNDDEKAALIGLDRMPLFLISR